MVFLFFSLFQSVLPLAQPQLGNPQVIAIAAGTTADFDLDGAPDLVVANGFLQSIGGPFRRMAIDCQSAPQALEAGPFSTQFPLALYKACAGGDTNGDLLPDLLTGNSEGAIELFENGGPTRMRTHGTPFRDPWTVEALSTTMGLSGPRTFAFPVFFLADLDRDGFRDLVACGYVMRLFQGSISTDLRVWFGDAQGQFHARAMAPVALPLAGRAADVDGDGTLEILVLSRDGVLVTFQVVGRGLQQVASQTVPAAWALTTMDVGDFTGDGTPDFVFAGDPGNANLALVPGAVGGAFLQGQFLGMPAGAGPSEVPSLRLVDMDADGMRDLLALQTFGANVPARLVYWHALGGGRFDTPAVLDLPGTLTFLFPSNNAPTPLPELLATADLDRDGNPEVILGMLQTQVGAPSSIAVCRNTWVPRCVVAHHGTGATGSGGFRPRIGVLGGLPILGQGDFAITLTDAVGDGAWATLLIGTTPVDVPVGNELSFYTLPRFASVHVTSGSGPGGGHVVVPCPIPDDANVIGLSCWFQWAIADIGPGRSIPVTTSNGLNVIVGQRF